MRTEWKFPFETRDFHFEREHTFKGSFTEPLEVDGEDVSDISFTVKIALEDRQPPPGVEQVGALFVTLPLRPDAAKDLAKYIAQDTAQRIAFSSGDFRVNLGYVVCRRIAETEADEAEIDGKPYSIEFSLVEALPTPAFDPEAFGEARGPLPLVAQFNDARRDEGSPVRKFLGFFRILESLSYPASGRPSLAEALLSNSEAGQHFHDVVEGASYEEFVDAVVDARHKCAHLKKARGFGYAPTDPEIQSVVEPLIPILEEVVRRCLAPSDRPSEGE